LVTEIVAMATTSGIKTGRGSRRYAGGMLRSDAAHDLLNPIAAIIGFADTLLDRWDVLDDEAKLAALRTIRRQSEELQRLAERFRTP
jgi:signal transduction histidine kinase